METRKKETLRSILGLEDKATNQDILIALKEQYDDGELDEHTKKQLIPLIIDELSLNTPSDNEHRDLKTINQENLEIAIYLYSKLFGYEINKPTPGNEQHFSDMRSRLHNSIKEKINLLDLQKKITERQEQRILEAKNNLNSQLWSLSFLNCFHLAQQGLSLVKLGLPQEEAYHDILNKINTVITQIDKGITLIDTTRVKIEAALNKDNSKSSIQELKSIQQDAKTSIDQIIHQGQSIQKEICTIEKNKAITSHHGRRKYLELLAQSIDHMIDAAAFLIVKTGRVLSGNKASVIKDFNLFQPKKTKAEQLAEHTQPLTEYMELIATKPG